MTDQEIERVLANVRSEIRAEVAYAISLSCACSAEWRSACPAPDCPHQVACPICEDTGRATWLDDCQECAPKDGTTAASECSGRNQ